MCKCNFPIPITPDRYGVISAYHAPLGAWTRKKVHHFGCTTEKPCTTFRLRAPREHGTRKLTLKKPHSLYLTHVILLMSLQTEFRNFVIRFICEYTCDGISSASIRCYVICCYVLRDMLLRVMDRIKYCIFGPLGAYAN